MSYTINERIGKCPNCGSDQQRNFYKSHWSKDGTQKIIEHHIVCSDCGYTVKAEGLTRKQAIRNVLNIWGFKEGFEYKTNPVYKEEEIKSFKEDSKTKDIEDAILSSLSKEKQDIFKNVNSLFINYRKENQNENYPCSKAEVLKLYGFSNDEIEMIDKQSSFKRVFLKSLDEVLDSLNNDIPVFCRDYEGILYKYTPVVKLEKTNEIYSILKESGLEKNAFILK